MDRLTIAQHDPDRLIAGSSVRTWFKQRLAKLLDRHLAAYIGEIRTDGLSSAVRHMTRGALPFPEEELPSCSRVAEYNAFRSRRIERVQQGGQRIQLGGRQIESRHARPR